MTKSNDSRCWNYLVLILRILGGVLGIGQYRTFHNTYTSNMSTTSIPGERQTLRNSSTTVSKPKMYSLFVVIRVDLAEPIWLRWWPHHNPPHMWLFQTTIFQPPGAKIYFLCFFVFFCVFCWFFLPVPLWIAPRPSATTSFGVTSISTPNLFQLFNLEAQCLSGQKLFLSA